MVFFPELTTFQIFSQLSRREGSSQLELEHAVFEKSKLASTGQEIDVLEVGQSLVVYRTAVDFQVYVAASKHENEVIVASVLHALFSALTNLTNGVLEKLSLLEHFDECMLVFDELIDDGFILETDPDVICHRVMMQHSTPDFGAPDHPLTQAFASAKEISRTLLR